MGGYFGNSGWVGVLCLQACCKGGKHKDCHPSVRGPEITPRRRLNANFPLLAKWQFMYPGCFAQQFFFWAFRVR